MKAKKITGWWGGEAIWREETAEETLARESAMHNGGKVPRFFQEVIHSKYPDSFISEEEEKTN